MAPKTPKIDIPGINLDHFKNIAKVCSNDVCIGLVQLIGWLILRTQISLCCKGLSYQQLQGLASNRALAKLLTPRGANQVENYHMLMAYDVIGGTLYIDVQALNNLGSNDASFGKFFENTAINLLTIPGKGKIQQEKFDPADTDLCDLHRRGVLFSIKGALQAEPVFSPSNICKNITADKVSLTTIKAMTKGLIESMQLEVDLMEILRHHAISKGVTEHNSVSDEGILAAVIMSILPNSDQNISWNDGILVSKNQNLTPLELEIQNQITAHPVLTEKWEKLPSKIIRQGPMMLNAITEVPTNDFAKIAQNQWNDRFVDNSNKKGKSSKSTKGAQK